MIYDFLIIGGGILDISAAYTLAAQGLVLLPEAESTTPLHATGRSAGPFTLNYDGPIVRQVNVASADFFHSPPIGLAAKRRTAIIIAAPENIDSGTLPAIDFESSGAYMKPDAGRLLASPGDATPMNPCDAWSDDMEIAVFADWIEQETTLRVAKIERSWAGLRSFVANEGPVVGWDADIAGFFWLAGQGGYGIMLAPALAFLTADICARPADSSLNPLATSLSPHRLLAQQSDGIV